MNENEKISRSVGFTQNVIGMIFKYNIEGNILSESSMMEITEIKTRSPKYKVIVKAKNGKLYKFTVDQAKTYLGGDKLINREANLNKF